jgi:hypothetical protein
MFIVIGSAYSVLLYRVSYYVGTDVNLTLGKLVIKDYSWILVLSKITSYFT